MPTFTRPHSIWKEGVAGQGLFTEREGKHRKKGEEENKLPGSHSSAVTCQWQLTMDGPPGRMSNGNHIYPSLTEKFGGLTAFPQDRSAYQGGSSALPAGGGADKGS